MSDRYLKCIDENLKSQPKQFWKYVTLFRKINSNQLEADGKPLIEPYSFADEFSNHFQSVYAYNNPRPVVFPILSSSSEFLSLLSVSDSDVIKAITRLRPHKSVGIDDIPGFIIKGFTKIFVPVLQHILI
jgi:hypothetical protein